MDSIPSQGAGESVRVYVRVRPPDPELESELDKVACLDVTSGTSLTVHCKPEPKSFTFDNVAGIQTTQEDVFLAVGRPIIDSCMRGYNGTIFAYGQTGSGKTFTMIGPSDNCDTFTHELRGIIPRSFEYLYSLINREMLKCGELVEFLCKCSFLEIYNEQVFDLLDPASAGLHLRENMKRGVYVDGLTEQSISSARDAYQVLIMGWVNRRVASTSMNRESSRSHAVFTLTIESKKRENKDSVAKIRSSLLNLVDLAGSERQRDTRTAGLRLKEAGSINKSLSALGNVIMALVDIANGKSRHVHYRDSKLTFLLRDSLGGNAKTNLVANVHPSSRCFGESLSTLNFARRAKMIKNKAVVNEDTSGSVPQLQAELRRLKELLERYKSGNAEPASPARAMIMSPVGYGASSDDDKTIAELRDMLAASMATRDKAEEEKVSLFERVEHMQKLCSKKEKFLQSTKMILKFRETHISNLEKASQSNENVTESTAIKLLQQEIEQLKFQLNHHPDAARLTMENIDLKAEVKRLRGSVPGRQDSVREMARSHQYTLQLERQLRHFLGSAGDVAAAAAPVKSTAGSPRPSSLSAESQRLQARCKQLQEILDKQRQTVSSEREASHLRESRLEAGLAAARKTNVELERSIEGLKLKNNVEKATLNDIHMHTIKSMMSPRREGANKSQSNTPYRRADSEPLKHRLTFTPSSSSLSTTSQCAPPPAPQPPPPILESPPTPPQQQELPGWLGKRSLGVNTDVTGDIPPTDSEGGELNIEGALTDELKILQDENSNLQQQLEEAERLVLRLSLDKTSLQEQFLELTQRSRSEREAGHGREQQFLEKISEMTVTIAELTSSTTVLEGEVKDLWVCLKSADKELAEGSVELKELTHKHEIRQMEHIQRIGELEQQLSSQVLEFERASEELQNITDEVETLREELGFREHQVGELERTLAREREAATRSEGEVQSLLDRLAEEAERSTRLSSELQDSGELVATLSENSRLQAELERLELDLRIQLGSSKQRQEEAEDRICVLLKRQGEDKEAIASFMAQVQELRAANTTSEAKVASLSQEVQDTQAELNTASEDVNILVVEVESLREQLTKQKTKHDREIRRKDTEREVVFEDLERLSDQYQQLTSTYEEQRGQLADSRSQAQRLESELEERETEIGRLHLQQRRSSSSSSRAHSFSERRDAVTKLQARDEEVDRLKWDLDHAAAVISNLEDTREDKNRELQRLMEQVAASECLHTELDVLQAKHTSLEYKLARVEDEQRQQESALRNEMVETKAELEELRRDYVIAIRSRDSSDSENAELRSKFESQCSTIDSLTDQLERYKVLEERLFWEKEAFKSQLEALQEERAKLAKECESLAKENALITGHRNIRQKIQYHAAIKMENNKLKEEVIHLNSSLKSRSDQVKQLQHLLSKPEPGTTGSELNTSATITTTTRHSKHSAAKHGSTTPTTTNAFKENIHPQE